MKTDLNSLKDELKKLTDLDYLKKELGQIASDLKKFDFPMKLTPQAKARLRTLEKRFGEVKKRVQILQKQVDGEVNKFISALRRTANGGLRSVRFAGRGNPDGGATAGSKTKKTGRRSVPKAPGAARKSKTAGSATTKKS